MTETEKLVLEVESKGLHDTNRDLATMDRRVQQAQGGFFKFKDTMLAMSNTASLAAQGFKSLAEKLFSATKTYQTYDAQLKIATKSSKGAAEALEALSDFAGDTPYSVDQAINSFIKLVNLGLNPSERALRSYGNTATSMNKQLTDVIEAVADASTGEFERFKEFGIKAKTEGEEVTFTFQNVETKVKKSAQAIQAYLIGIGEVQFAGAMKEQMKGVVGAASNLEDAWNTLWIQIAKQGPDSLITQAFQEAGVAVASLNADIASGATKQRIIGYGYMWKGVTDSIVDGFGIATDFIKGSTNLWGIYGKSANDEYEEFFKHFPINARLACDLVANYFLNLYERIAAGLVGMAERWEARLEQIVGYAKVAGQAIFDFMFNNDQKDISAELDAIDKIANARVAAATAVEKEKKKAADVSYEETRAMLVKEKDEKIRLVEEALKEADILRQQYDAAAATRKANQSDRLAKFAPMEVSGEEVGLAKIAKTQMEHRLKFIESGFQSEDAAVMHFYEAQRDEILAMTDQTDQWRFATSLQRLQYSLGSELDVIEAGYDDRLRYIRDSTLLTEDTKTALTVAMTQERAKAVDKIEKQSMDDRLNQSAKFFNDIASIGSAFGKKGFKVAQAASIAAATVDMYQAAVTGYANGVKAGGPYAGVAVGALYAAAAIAAGTANIVKIKSTTYSGAYAHGGMIPGGKYGLVGEAGPEFVRGPAIVTSASTSAARSGPATGVNKVTINNNGAPVEATTQMQGDELLIFLAPILAATRETTKKELSHEIRRGGSPIAKAIESTYGTTRQ